MSLLNFSDSLRFEHRVILRHKIVIFLGSMPYSVACLPKLSCIGIQICGPSHMHIHIKHSYLCSLTIICCLLRLCYDLLFTDVYMVITTGLMQASRKLSMVCKYSNYLQNIHVRQSLPLHFKGCSSNNWNLSLIKWVTSLQMFTLLQFVL